MSGSIVRRTTLALVASSIAAEHELSAVVLGASSAGAEADAA